MRTRLRQHLIMDDDVLHLMCGTPELPPGTVALTYDDGPGTGRGAGKTGVIRYTRLR